GHHWYSEWLFYKGKEEEGLKEIALAVELDPVSQAIIRDQGMAFYYIRQYDKAIENANTALALDPNFISVSRLLSLAYQGKGMYDEAIEHNQRWGELTRNEVKTKLALAQILAAASRHDEARKLLDVIHATHALFENDYRSMGLIYAALGDKDLAFEWLGKSCDKRESGLCSLKLDPKLDGLRDDPRFQKLIDCVGLS
ncbi:MAG: hypothetical protein ABIQ11_12305, partial [Saprospiraceae bacterium]